MKHTALNEGWLFSLDGQDPKQVILPHDFSMEKPRSADGLSGKDGGWYDGGIGEYTMKLEHPGTARCHLFIDGSQGLTEVWINHNRACFHPNGYTPFVADLTGFLEQGENALRILVNNCALPSSRWYTGSGLYRSVELLTGPEVYIPCGGFFARTLAISEEGARVRFEVEVEGGESDVSLSIYTPGGELAAQAVQAHVSKSAVFEIQLSADSLWTVETPSLWRAEAELSSGDSESIVFGIRTVECDPNRGLLINGEPVKLRGGCLHHDNGPLGACSFKDSERRKIALMKSVGYNAIRTAHNPPSSSLLEICDELGMYVLDEAFDCWRHGKVPFDYHLFFEDWWERDLTAMVRRDRTHPSVIMWSNGNEIPERGGNSFGYETARQLTEKFHQMDDRPVTHALCNFWDVPKLDALQRETEGESFDAWARYTAPCAAMTDVVGYNYAHERVEKDRAVFPNRLILLTETFPLAAAPSWQAVLDHPYVTGDFVWTGWDYIGESGIGHIAYDCETTRGLKLYPWHIANCGDFDICGTRRPQSYYREIVWGMRDTPYMAVLDPQNASRSCAVSMWGFPDMLESWTFPGNESKRTKVYVFSDADVCELQLNGVSVGEMDVDDTRMCIFDVEYQPGELTAISYRDGVRTGEVQLVTCGEAAQLRIEHIWIGEQLLYADVVACDAQGNVTAAEPAVHISVEGGQLLAMGNGDPQSDEQYPVSVRRAWRGRTTVIVRCEGEVSIHAEAEGLSPVDWSQARG